MLDGKMISNQSTTHCSIISIHLSLTDVIDLFHKGQSINNSFVFMQIDVIDFSHKWQPINHSFIFMNISLTRLASMCKIQ